MNRIIEGNVGQMLPVKRAATSAQPQQLSAQWQNGFEADGVVQRKLRLTVQPSVRAAASKLKEQI